MLFKSSTFHALLCLVHHFRGSIEAVGVKSCFEKRHERHTASTPGVQDRLWFDLLKEILKAPQSIDMIWVSTRIQSVISIVGVSLGAELDKCLTQFFARSHAPG